MVYLPGSGVMLCGCIVTKLKSTFDSLVCEFTAKASERTIGVVSRCRCNIFTIGNRCTSSVFCFSSSIIYKSFSHLKPVNDLYVACSRLMRCPCCKSCGGSRVRGLISGVWSYKANLAREEKPDLHTESSEVKPHHIRLYNCERNKSWLR